MNISWTIQKSSRYPTTMNVNRYATKKTIAQGMLDIALLTANASQLKYVLQVGKERHPFYTLMVTLISISIVLQVSHFDWLELDCIAIFFIENHIIFNSLCYWIQLFEKSMQQFIDWNGS